MIHTFFEAVVLVVLVVFVFLQSLRLTIIPTLAVPVSILGAMIGMLAFGFSVNMLTLFGMILAIGIVVDDAIVVIENTERNMTQFGLSPKEAAKRAMSEVSGALIAIVLVLNAVFIPVAFLGGMTGQLYKQFAVTIAISVVFSGLVALTLSPALAVILIKPGHGEKHGFFKWFENTLEAPPTATLQVRGGSCTTHWWHSALSVPWWSQRPGCSRCGRVRSCPRKTRATCSYPTCCRMRPAWIEPKPSGSVRPRS